MFAYVFELRSCIHSSSLEGSLSDERNESDIDLVCINDAHACAVELIALQAELENTAACNDVGVEA